MKLHLGCGNIRKEGFINIDVRPTDATDIICDIRNLDYTDNSIERIESYHLVEHFKINDIKEIFKKWFAWLKEGGVLVIECPDLKKSFEEFFKNPFNEGVRKAIWGDNRFPEDHHLYGFYEDNLIQLLGEAGFKIMEFSEGKDYHSQEMPCLRVEAIK